MHIAEVYMREKFMVVNVLSKIFAGLEDNIKGLGGGKAKSKGGRGLPSWYKNPNPNAVIIDADGDLNSIRNTFGAM